jgi:anti-sigma B factor antagonist
LTGGRTGPEDGDLDDRDDLGEVPGDGGSIAVDESAGVTTIVLRGEVDAALAQRLGELRAQATAAGHAVTVDLSAVTFMDSSGAAFLVHLYRSVQPQPVTLLRPTAAVRYLLDVTQLTRILRVQDA